MGFLKDQLGLDRKKIELIIAGSLALIFISAAMTTFKKVGKKPRGEKPAVEKVKNPAAPRVDYDVLNEKFSAMEWKRDPFQIGIVRTGETSYDSLTGIIWDENMPMAIFGERFLRGGDEVSNYKILRVKKEAVILTDGNLIYELRIGQSLADLVDDVD